VTVKTHLRRARGRAHRRDGGTWQRIHEAGVLHDWASVDAVALAIGATSPTGRVNGTGRRLVLAALRGRAGVDVKTEERRGRRTQWSKHYAHVRWLDKWGDATDGFTQDLFGDPPFESPEAARAAWPMCRRAVIIPSACRARRSYSTGSSRGRSDDCRLPEWRRSRALIPETLPAESGLCDDLLRSARNGVSWDERGSPHIHRRSCLQRARRRLVGRRCGTGGIAGAH
jgi:hypothetical protein